MIWRGDQTQYNPDTLSTGYTELDAQLNGGFPLYGVVEITSNLAIGELRLLTPTIQSTGKKKLSVFINPPGYLCSEYLAQQGISLERVIMIFPQTSSKALWAAEQCLKSGCCGTVTLWHPSLEIHQARRLQVASETGGCLHFLFKTETQQKISLPVSLSMQLTAKENGITVTVNKRKGGWLKATFFIEMTELWPQLSTNPSLSEEQQSNIRYLPVRQREQA